MSFIFHPIASILGLNRPYSYISIVRSQTFTFAVSKEFLTAPSAKLINPRNHAIKTDQVYMNLPASAIGGLDDEAVLVLFTRGFFGGWVFFLERWFMKLGGWRWLPPRFTGFKGNKTEKIIWKCSDIPKTTLLPVGDTAFGAFKVIDSNLKSASSPSDSFLEFGFGSDNTNFGGCHRFSIHRYERKNELDSDVLVRQNEVQDGEEAVQIRLEHFRCNPKRNVDSWAEYIPLVHYWYAKMLFANGITSILGR